MEVLRSCDGRPTAVKFYASEHVLAFFSVLKHVSFFLLRYSGVTPYLLLSVHPVGQAGG